MAVRVTLLAVTEEVSALVSVLGEQPVTAVRMTTAAMARAGAVEKELRSRDMGILEKGLFFMRILG